MQVDPQNMFFSDIKTNEELEKSEAIAKDEVIVTSDSVAQLRKLQDDLRKAGYKKLK